MLFALALALAFQPDVAVVRKVFEDHLARQRQEFGATDPHTAQAARDLGLFLRANGDTAGALRALAEAVRIDDSALGASSAQTLEDVAALASVSPAAAVGPLLKRAAQSPDPVVAGQALSTLAGLQKAAGDAAGAVAGFRAALAKAEQAEGPDSRPVELILTLLLPLERQVLGPRHEQTIGDTNRLAAIYRKSGRFREAAALTGNNGSAGR